MNDKVGKTFKVSIHRMQTCRTVVFADSIDQAIAFAQANVVFSADEGSENVYAEEVKPTEVLE